MGELLFSLTDWLIIFVVGTVGTIVVAKVRLYRIERLRQLADACTSVADEQQRRELGSTLNTLLREAFDNAKSSFVDYYTDISQLQRVLYIIGSGLLLVATSLFLILLLFIWDPPDIDNLASDTVIATKFGIGTALHDMFLNLVILITTAVFTSSIVWLFTYVGRRLLVVYRIAFTNRKVANPKRINTYHIVLTTIGLTVPFALLVFSYHLARSEGRFEGMDGEALLQSDEQDPKDDKIDKKLKTARLVLYYREEMCPNTQIDKEKVAQDIILGRLDQENVKTFIENSKDTCPEKAFSDTIFENHDATDDQAQVEQALRSWMLLRSYPSQMEGIE